MTKNIFHVSLSALAGKAVKLLQNGEWKSTSSKMAVLIKTDNRAEQAIEAFDQRPSEIRALLNLKVACLF